MMTIIRMIFITMRFVMMTNNNCLVHNRCQVEEAQVAQLSSSCPLITITRKTLVTIFITTTRNWALTWFVSFSSVFLFSSKQKWRRHWIETDSGNQETNFSSKYQRQWKIQRQYQIEILTLNWPPKRSQTLHLCFRMEVYIKFYHRRPSLAWQHIFI